jgi:hypothetical protein
MHLKLVSHFPCARAFRVFLSFISCLFWFPGEYILVMRHNSTTPEEKTPPAAAADRPSDSGPDSQTSDRQTTDSQTTDRGPDSQTTDSQTTDSGPDSQTTDSQTTDRQTTDHGPDSQTPDRQTPPPGKRIGLRRALSTVALVAAASAAVYFWFSNKKVTLTLVVKPAASARIRHAEVKLLSTDGKHVRAHIEIDNRAGQFEKHRKEFALPQGRYILKTQVEHRDGSLSRTEKKIDLEKDIRLTLTLR